jgi:hypothetical protein
MPIIIQLLTESEFQLLRKILPEKSFFSRGDPSAISTLLRDLRIQNRVEEISHKYVRSKTGGPNRGSMVQQLADEFGLCKRMMWRILKRLEGRARPYRKFVQKFVTDFATNRP